MNLRPKSLSNRIDQMSSKNYQYLFECAIKKIIHPQIGKSCIGKIKNLNYNLRYYCRQRIEALAHRQCKFDCMYWVRFEHIVQSVNKISYDSVSNLKSYWNERISCQRTSIHIFLQHEGTVWIM